MAKFLHSVCVCLTLLITLQAHFAWALHVDGVWNSNTDSLKILARFGVQKTDTHHDEDTNGYVFGNVTVTSKNSPKSQRNTSTCHNGLILLVNRTMFSAIRALHSSIALEPKSQDHSQFQDRSLFCNEAYETFHESNKGVASTKYVRHIPCFDSDKPIDSINQTKIKDSRFTYVLDNQKEANFWYLLLLACVETPVKGDTNKTIWVASNTSSQVIHNYDFWLVNGHPEEATGKIVDFDHQFSFEQQNLMFFLFLDICYVILLIFQCFTSALRKFKNFGSFFTISLALQCLSYSFICIHKFAFAHDGKGFEILFTISELLKFVSMGMFIMFVLLIAKGWPMTKQEILSKTILYIVCSLYTFIRVLLFIWIKSSLNMIDEIDEYQILPGWLNLLIRIGLMSWFLHEIRHTMVLEQESTKLKFYLHFGAGILVWFVHLPLVVMVALQIDLMWRYKIITGFSSVADVLAYTLVLKLLWDLKKINLMARDEEDYEDTYDNSSLYPSETYKFSSTANYRSNHAYDDRSDCDIKA